MSSQIRGESRGNEWDRARSKGLSPECTQKVSSSGGVSVYKLLLRELGISRSKDYKHVESLITGDESFEQIMNMVRLPFYLEQFMIFGLLSCLNSFLKLLVILPLKLILDVCLLVLSFRNQLIPGKQTNFQMSYHKMIDLKNLVFTSLIISTFFLSNVDTSRIYHAIRAQSSIKLYVMFGVLEVSDKLLSTVGQDLLNYLLSSHITGSGRISFVKFGLFYLASLAYLACHTIVLIYQTISLNVAANSYSNSLVTLLLSNQFSEIKGAVFKRIDREGLFQMSCADIVERFQLLTMLTIISFKNLAQIDPSNIGILPNSSFSNWNNSKLIGILLGPTAIVIGSELLVDWVKHSYMTKFNKIRPKIYVNYLNILSSDAIDNYRSSEIKHDMEFIDKIQQRLGLPIPALFVLFIVMSKHTFQWFLYNGQHEIILSNASILVILFFTVLFLKLLLELFLLKWSNSTLKKNNQQKEKHRSKNHEYTNSLVSGGLGAMDNTSRKYLYDSNEKIPPNNNEIRDKKDEKSDLHNVTRYEMHSKRIW
ncbi:hypothetical protein WICMUC_004031 [Wickerhamomyces mucosus]|uniref:Uncharacterized protein n=1 Tax=Wickerhamomyces mucosus TaxID=1378264 RepID=A0A9P8PK71_9ASCO|nr:hypothetical protein WICMUC_004031 [Wickerhamomyces mucosus]